MTATRRQNTVQLSVVYNKKFCRTREEWARGILNYAVITILERGICVFSAPNGLYRIYIRSERLLSKNYFRIVLLRIKTDSEHDVVIESGLKVNKPNKSDLEDFLNMILSWWYQDRKYVSRIYTDRVLERY
jgi:hypothetical protein